MYARIQSIPPSFTMTSAQPEEEVESYRVKISSKCVFRNSADDGAIVRYGYCFLVGFFNEVLFVTRFLARAFDGALDGALGDFADDRLPVDKSKVTSFPAISLVALTSGGNGVTAFSANS